LDISFLKWTGHAGFMFETKGSTVYIDPFKIGTVSDRADVVFISHSHFDHLYEADLKRIADEKTLFVAPGEAAEKLPFKRNVTLASPGKSGTVHGIDFEAVAAYNVEPVRLQYHPKAAGMVGYVVEVEGKRVYHAGDTDVIKEMEGVRTDLALLPAGGTYTMDVDQALRATKVVKAKTYAPMHYRALLGLEGSKALEKRFTDAVSDSIILTQINEPLYSF